MKHRIILPVLLLIAFLAGCTGTGATQPGRGQAKPPTPTPVPTPSAAAKTTFLVERGEVVKEARLTGRIAPVEQRELFFRTSGRVRQVYVQQNAVVKAGQPLADLENANLKRELASTQLELERTLVRADTAEKARQNNIKRAIVSLEIARLSLDATLAQDVTPRLAQAQADLDKADLALKKAQADYDAIKWRGDIGATPQALTLQQVTIAHSQARAAYDLALQTVSAHDFDVKIKTQQVRVAQISLDELNEQGADPLLKNDVDRARLNVEKLEAAIADTQIAAPFDGELVSIVLTEGQAVEAFKPIAVVADPTRLEVSAKPASSSDSSDLTVGMAAKVTFISSAASGPLSGTIRRLPYLLTTTTTTAATTKPEDRDTTVRITLDTPAKQGGYVLGDLVEVTVVLQRRENALWLPPDALRIFQDRRFVVIQEGNAQRRVNLKIGIEGADRVEILDGVTEGQVVLGQP